MTEDQKNQFGSLDYVQLSIYPLILVFGAIGNTLVILVVKNKKRNRKINDYFILNLAISDVFMLTISICADFYLKFQASPYGNILCKGIWPFMTMCLFASVFTLTCMALERWRTIVKPLCPRLPVSIVYLLIGLTWFAGLIFVLPLIIVAYHKGRKCKEDWPAFAMRQAYTVAIAAFQYLFPLLIITVAYARIGSYLKKRSKMVITAESHVSRRGVESIRRKLENAKINKNLRFIVVLFALFMLPKQVLWLWLDFGNGGQFKHFSDVLTFGEFLLYIHSSANPIVYGTILGEYRAGFRRYLSHFLSVIGWYRCVSGIRSTVHPDPTYAADSASQENSMELSKRREIKSLNLGHGEA